jgi:HEPN domain-containing protein
MSGLPENLHVVRGWIQKAENDRINAKFVLTMEYACPTDTACFHAQQCAEKYFKALLTFREIRFPKTQI